MNIRVISVIIIGLLLLDGCASLRPKDDFNPDDIMVFPSPPDEPKIQFLTRYSSSSDITSFNKIDKFLFGKNLLALEKVIVKPYGISLFDGKLYICDTMLPGIEIIDLRKRSFELFQPFGRGTLRKPINITHDQNGNIYVADTDRKQVVVFSKDLKFLRSIESKSSKPIDIAIKGDSLFIADLEDRNIKIWSLSKNRFISDFPKNNVELPDSIRIFVPYSIEIDQKGNIYVTDFGQFRIQMFDSEGNFIRSFGGIGRSLGKFARPKGIAVDHEQRLYVVDAAFENVQMFNKEGQLLLFFGGTYDRPGNMYLPAQLYIDYDNIDLFQSYVLPGYTLEFLIFVTNQYGPDKISVYGFINPENKPEEEISTEEIDKEEIKKEE